MRNYRYCTGIHEVMLWITSRQAVYVYSNIEARSRNYSRRGKVKSIICSGCVPAALVIQPAMRIHPIIQGWAKVGLQLFVWKKTNSIEALCFDFWGLFVNAWLTDISFSWVLTLTGRPLFGAFQMDPVSSNLSRIL